MDDIHVLSIEPSRSNRISAPMPTAEGQPREIGFLVERGCITGRTRKGEIRKDTFMTRPQALRWDGYPCQASSFIERHSTPSPKYSLFHQRQRGTYLWQNPAGDGTRTTTRFAISLGSIALSSFSSLWPSPSNDAEPPTITTSPNISARVSEST